jgi:hypothetical protein
MKKIGESYEIECPKCRQRSINNLPICYAIYDKILLDDKSDIDMSCEIHEYEKLNFYCNDDKVMLCPICLVQNHRDHDVGLLKDKYIANEYIDRLNKWKEYLIMKNDEFNFQKNLLQNCIKECEEDKSMLFKRVEVIYNEFVDNYDKYQLELIQEVENLNINQTNNSRNIQINIDNVLNNINKIIDNNKVKKELIEFNNVKIIKQNDILIDKVALSDDNKMKFYDFKWNEDIFFKENKQSLKLRSYENDFKNNIFVLPDSKDSTILIFDLTTNTFMFKELLIGSDHEFLDYSSVTQMNEDTLLITGGCNYSNFRNTATNKTFLVKLINKKHVFIKEYIPMNINRFSHGSLLINGIVYVFGGHNGRHTLASMECINPISDYWTALPDMNLEKEIFAYCSVKDRYIYTFGGFCESHLDIIERYDIVREKWKILKTKLKIPLQNSTAINVRDEFIVLIGGYNYNLQRSISIFNLNTCEWNEIDYQMKIPRRRAHCYLYDNKVILTNLDLYYRRRSTRGRNSSC